VKKAAGALYLKGYCPLDIPQPAVIALERYAAAHRELFDREYREISQIFTFPKPGEELAWGFVVPLVRTTICPPCSNRSRLIRSS
jgi:hypothetical protein